MGDTTMTDDQTHTADNDAGCPNEHGADLIIECWSPGGPCPEGQTVCECCGPCNHCAIPEACDCWPDATGHHADCVSNAAARVIPPGVGTP
jgi:hypothetical protein